MTIDYYGASADDLAWVLDSIVNFDQKIESTPDTPPHQLGPWYLGSPYSKYAEGHQVAWRDAVSVTASLLRVGVVAYSPIIHMHPVAVAGNFDLTDLDLWLKTDHVTIPVCRGMIVAKLPGWDESKGIAAEIIEFQKLGRPIFYLPIPNELLRDVGP